MLEPGNEPFPTSDLVIVLWVFLNFNIGKVTGKIKNVFSIIGFMGKPGKPLPIEPDRKLTIIGAQNINPEIKLLASEQQRLVNVLLDYVCLVLFRLLFGLLNLLFPWGRLLGFCLLGSRWSMLVLLRRFGVVYALLDIRFVLVVVQGFLMPICSYLG